MYNAHCPLCCGQRMGYQRSTVAPAQTNPRAVTTLVHSDVFHCLVCGKDYAIPYRWEKLPRRVLA